MMNSNFQELKSFLNKLFQFESEDLDFGIYKILHYKRKEVKEFIDKLLVDKVKEQLQTFTADELKTAKDRIEDLEQDADIQRWLKAVEKNDLERLKIYQEDYTQKIKDYKNVSRQLGAAELADNTEDLIYNHLTRFFSRYYDKGDFISKRRYGKTEKYTVPYNGEETHFYWANHDQYYIKSSEYFQQFAFKIPQLNGTLMVNFKLTDAQTEQGNVKAEENKYFVLSEKVPELTDDVLNIFFEFRPLNESEKKILTGNGKQDTLNEQAAAKLKAGFSDQTITAELWKEDEKQQTLLLRKLHHYTRKNTYDFFIHKDLKGFLQRELDFYIKSELVKVEDLYVLESEQHFENIRHNFKLIKCFKNIADTIIDFLSQIEEFQKKLWEKKKFVLSAEWVITLDKLVQWVDKEIFESIVSAVLKNEAQKEEWKKLFGWNELPFNLSVDGLKADLHNWYKLPVDTRHFSSGFKETLLNALSDKINIEEEANGLVIHSDNYHGLQLLQEKFHDQVKCIYIDPPYNIGGDGFLYKDGFQHSSWLSMLNSQLDLSKNILSNDGVSFYSIDDAEQKNLTECVNLVFGYKNFIANIIWQKKFSPQNDAKWLSDNHDFIICSARNKEIWRPTLLVRTEDQNERYSNPDKDIRGEWASSGLDVKTYSAEYDYPITTPSGRIVYPPKGSCWRFSKEKLEELITEKRIWFGKNGNNVPRIKRFLSEVKAGVTPLTIWTHKEVGHNQEATQELKNIGFYTFTSPKPTRLLERILKIGSDSLSYILDYFAGSGTSYHATCNLNNQDGGNRKCILIEQGNYVYTVILPRIKKIAYSFDWKDGKPQNMNGLGVFIKYQRLEQYEEALENIAFSATEKTVQQALQFDEYLPKYFLELETRGSKTLVNIEVMQNPWNYALKTWDGFTYDTEQAVDLAETFNYLIGLHVQKYFTWNNEEKKYVFIWGWNNERKKNLIVWRDITNWKVDDYEKDRDYIESKLPLFEYDYLYINGQSVVPGCLMTEDIFKTKMLPA